MAIEKLLSVEEIIRGTKYQQAESILQLVILVIARNSTLTGTCRSRISMGTGGFDFRIDRSRTKIEEKNIKSSERLE